VLERNRGPSPLRGIKVAGVAHYIAALHERVRSSQILARTPLGMERPTGDDSMRHLGSDKALFRLLQ
jgi:hypothetical protein